MSIIDSQLYKHLDNILPQESMDTKINYCISLALMVFGKIGLEEAAMCSGMSPAHFASFIDNKNIPKSSFIEKVVEEAEDWKNDPGKKGLQQFIKQDGHKATIETKVFTIIGNNVMLHAEEKQYKGLQYSLKKAGGRYDNKSKSWYLTDAQLEAWIESQKPFGWFK